MKKIVLSIFFSGILFFIGMSQKTVFLESLGTKDTIAAEKINVPVSPELNKTRQKGFKDLFENVDPASNAGPRLNPRAASFVKDYMEKNSDDLLELKGWGMPYFNMMDKVLVSHKLPKELKYLAVIESRLHPGAVSWVGAVGPWQLMPETARILGLKVNRRVDERTNYIKSTHAAARYLTDLYTQFGDWLLVIAAYNGGAGNVERAIRKSGSRNFWDLQYYLPAESRNHVKKFIGTHYIFEGQGGLTTLTKSETEENYGAFGYGANRRLSTVELNTARTQTISGKYLSAVIAKYVVMDVPEFNRYNPDFDRVMASANNSYELKLPAEKMDLFNTGKYQILNESIQQLLTNALSISNPVNQKQSTALSKTGKK